MSQKKIISLLNSLILQEEKKLISTCPADNSSKKVMLYSLLRGFDTFFLFVKDKEKYVHHYEYGWLRSLALVYGDYVNEKGWPLLKSEEKMSSFTHWFILQAGQIEFCKKIIGLMQAGLGIATVKGKLITVEFKNIGVMEEFDNQAFLWVHNLFHEHVCEPELKEILKDVEKVRKKMRSLVNKWRTHYIQYDTTPEIDNVFDKFAYYQLLASEGKKEFGPDALFGSIPYSKYFEFVMVVCGIALKHYHFCLELYDKYEGEISFPDIITITKDRMGFIESVAKFLDVSVAESEQMLDSITLCSENIEYHSNRPRAAPPPFIKIADNSLIQSIVGSQVSPYDFLNRELRRKYEKDYFQEVNNREKILREQLYACFEEDSYAKVDKEVIFRSSKGISDIDAAIYDKDANVLGLFQLKWQDMYGASMKERYSRISNLYPKTVEWIDKVESWVNESDVQEALRKFGLKCEKVPVEVLLFIVCRHGTFFTGYEPDRRAAWSSIWLIMKMFSQIQRNTPNKLQVLYNLLHQEYSVISSTKRVIEEEMFKIGEYEIHLKAVQ